MGLFDRSSSRTEVANTYRTETNTQQTDQSGNTGLNLSNIGGGLSLTDSTTINSIDGGALDVAANIAAGAYGLGSQALTGALNFGRTSVDSIAKVNADSLSLLGGLVSGAIDNSRTITRDSLAASKDSVQQAISGFQSLATQNSQSSDDRVQKVALYALAAIAAVFILPALFNGKGKGAFV